MTPDKLCWIRVGKANKLEKVFVELAYLNDDLSILRNCIDKNKK